MRNYVPTLLEIVIPLTTALLLIEPCRNIRLTTSSLSATHNADAMAPSAAVSGERNVRAPVNGETIVCRH